MVHKGSSVEDTVATQAALDFFVGMVYAVMLGLLVANAHNASLFDSLLFTGAFFLLLFFFVQDWMSRELCNRRIRQQVRRHVAAGPYSLKVFFDVLVAYLLLLSSLRLIELAVLASPSQIFSPSLMDDPMLRTRFALFGIAAGFWNLIVILTSELFENDEKRMLLTGCVPSSLLAKYFPKITEWQDTLETRFRALDQQQVTSENTGSSVPPPPASGEADPAPSPSAQVLGGTLEGHIRAWYLILREGIRSPLKVLAPYALVLHLLFLNVILGTILIWSAHVAHPVFHRWYVAVPLVSGFLSLWGYSLILSPRPKTEANVERLALAFLFFTVITVYFIGWAISPSLLVLFVVLQQLAVNHFMVRYFRPSPAAGTD